MLLLVSFVLLGIIAGGLSGLVGAGGGIVIVPALIFLFGFAQKDAQGTTLAVLVPPIGAAAAYAYYRHGNVNLRVAILIALGFILGSYLTSHFANHVSNGTLTKIFAIFLLVVGIKMFFLAK